MKLITAKELAQKLCTTVGVIYTYVSTHQVIPRYCVIKTSRALRFDEDSIDAWLNKKRLEPLPSMP